MTTPNFARFALLLAFSTLGACAIIPDTPRVGQEAASQGTPIAFGQSAWLGDAIVTPLALVEDSRCPVHTQCVQTGKLTVSTRITSTHWQQTVPLTLGEPYRVMSRNFVLVSATPANSAGQEISPGAYRFAFTAGSSPPKALGQAAVSPVLAQVISSIALPSAWSNCWSSILA